MLNRTWKIVLLLVALILALWPAFRYSQWVVAIVILVLLIGEFSYKDRNTKTKKKGK